MKHEYSKALAPKLNAINYGAYEESIPYDRILNQYAKQPNETVYVVGYKHMELEFLKKKTLTSFDIPIEESRNLDILAEHVDVNSKNSLINFGKSIVGFTQSSIGKSLLPELDAFSCVYKSISGRVLLKSSFLLKNDEYGNMVYSIGKITDITGLYPYKGFRYQIYGPNATAIMAGIGQVHEFSKLLSKREIEILILVSKGLASKQIAAELFISVETVNTHRKNIIRKLEVSCSIAAYKKAEAIGLLR